MLPWGRSRPRRSWETNGTARRMAGRGDPPVAVVQFLTERLADLIGLHAQSGTRGDHLVFRLDHRATRRDGPPGYSGAGAMRTLSSHYAGCYGGKSAAQQPTRLSLLPGISSAAALAVHECLLVARLTGPRRDQEILRR